MQQQVFEFMRRVKDLEPPSIPMEPDASVRNLCFYLIDEEWLETQQAMMRKQFDFVELADGLADLLYVVFYMCNAYGINIEPIFNEVHRSNMLKKGGEKRADGKQLKPKDWQPPVLLPLLEQQMEFGNSLYGPETNDTD